VGTHADSIEICYQRNSCGTVHRASLEYFWYDFNGNHLWESSEEGLHRNIGGCMSINVLIIGNTGFLGSSLSKMLDDDDIRIDSVGREFIDLRFPIPLSFNQFLTAGYYDFALICAAISDIEKCFQDPKRSHQINVVGTINLLEVLRKKEIIPIFFSSDYVFEPTNSTHGEEDNRKPATYYGKQKLLVENYMQSHFDRYLIFRTSKLMSMTAHPKNILLPAIRNLSTGTAAKYFKDQWLNPVFVEDIAEVLKLSFRRAINGVFHLGSRQILSRYKIGQLLAEMLDFDADLIEHISFHGMSFSEPRPTHNTLNCEKIERTLDYTFRELADVRDQLKFLICLPDGEL
jgi:dTDP-4-dehydrorhamnose reductase